LLPFMTTPEGGTPFAPGEEAVEDLSPAALRRRYATAFRPNPILYYADMLASAMCGWTAFALAIGSTRYSVLWLASVIVATFALYRAVLFIHEISHLKRRSVPGFELVWSLAVGLPLLVPSLMYKGSHGEHHRRAVFGTDRDPEYAPIGQWSKARVFASTLPLLFVPLALVLRWGVFGPIAWFLPPLHRFLVGSFSTLVINPAYKRRLPEGRMAERWFLQELGTALVCWVVAAAMVFGLLPTAWLVEWYIVSCTILVLNHLRTLVAHRYHNHDGTPMDLLEQYRDSVNLSGGHPLDALMAPVGLRYHALHHLLPTVPYHSLGSIHRKLLAQLPPTAPYHVAEHPTLLHALRNIFGDRALTSSAPRR